MPKTAVSAVWRAFDFFMFRERLTLRNLSRRVAPWQLTPEERYAERARRFFQGAPLALAAVAALLPAWLFLVQAPRLAYAPIAAAVVLPLLGITAAVGIAKLVNCAVEHPFDHLTAVSFGVLLVVGVVLIYTGVFLYLLYQ